jgi:ABC-type multidrug transport system fused ATPase/permease subunit
MCPLLYLSLFSPVRGCPCRWQGKILDHIIQADYEAFILDIKLFLIFTLTLMTFSATQSITLSIVGARMRTDLRNHMFDAIMCQDTAFFDGISTGDLTARLSDCDASINPVQGLISMPTDVFLLIGGLVMCVYTSARLAILSITAIGPIVLVMRVYARWSKRINQRIRESLARASTIAVQTIENLRTVRAFGCEPYERRRVSRGSSPSAIRRVAQLVVS